MEYKLYKLTVEQCDLDAAIDAIRTEPFRRVSECCPVFQCMQRNGLKPMFVAVTVAVSEDESSHFSLDEAASHITCMTANDWETLKPRLPINITLEEDRDETLVSL